MKKWMSGRATATLVLLIGLLSAAACANRSLAISMSDDRLGQWRLWTTLAIIVLLAGRTVMLMRALAALGHEPALKEVRDVVMNTLMAPLLELPVSLLGLTMLGQWVYTTARSLHTSGWWGDLLLAVFWSLGAYQGSTALTPYVLFMWCFPDIELTRVAVWPPLVVGMIVTIAGSVGTQLGSAYASNQRIRRQSSRPPDV